MRRGFALLLLTLAGGIARADEPPKPPGPPARPAAASVPVAKPAAPPTPEQAADAVLAAAKAKDDAALKALAAKDAPDAWLVADELIRRGEFDAADAFAKAAPRADVETLPAYVASRRGKPDDAVRRARLAAANVALSAVKPDEALTALGAPEAGPIDDVVGVRLAMGRGISLGALGKFDAAEAVFVTAGDAAERLGWLARSDRALGEAGLSAFRRSAVAVARDLCRRRLALAERRGDAKGRAVLLGFIGNFEYQFGDYAAALEAFERGLKIEEDLGDKVGAALTRGNIASVYDVLGQYERALATQAGVLSALEALGDRAGVAHALGNIGNIHVHLAEFPKALEFFTRALAAEEALGDRAGAARILGNLGIVSDALGDFERALAMHERAFATFESMGDRSGAATALSNIGNVQFRLGAYERALDSFQRALAEKEALQEKVGAALTLGNIGNVHESLGNYAKALAADERALAVLTAAGDRAGAANVLSNIGNVQFRLGEFAKSLSTFERAFASRDALKDAAGAARTLGNIGNVYESIGDYKRALATQEHVLALLEAIGDRAGAANTLSNLGNVHFRLGDPAGALTVFERAMAAKRALKDDAGAALTLGNIAAIHDSQGDATKALEENGRALAALEAMGNRAGAALTLINIGLVHLRLGQAAGALRAFERAAQVAEKLGASALLVSALCGLANARLGSGDAGRAIPEAHRAVSLLKTLVGGLGDEQGATARGQFTALFSIGLSAAARSEDVSEAAFFLESGRAGSLLESLDARDALRHAAIPEELRIAEAMARAVETQALAAYAKALDVGDLPEIRARDAQLKAARATVQEVVERIQREAKKESHLWYPVATPIDDIQGLLVAGDAMVLYGLAEKGEPAHALVLTRADARIVRLGRSSDVVAACEALHASDPIADPAAALARLRDLVVRPLGLPKETKRLLVSPEGPLSYVPFAALLPDLVVAYESSGSTYGVLREEKEKHGEQVLALGDPDYTATSDPTALALYAPVAVARDAATRGGRLVSLPATREEATAVADVKLFGKDASESGLRAALGKRSARWHAVHFACHGLVDPDHPTLSSLALTPEGKDDGFLTALEVLKMEIPSDLVVLSACETGKGKIVGGEGIVGLTRAFMYAGSPRVICSLWKVDDDATRALMVKFYELWNPKDGKPGLPTAEALRKAQEFVKSQEQWKHPYFWAAWVLWGLPE